MCNVHAQYSDLITKCTTSKIIAKNNKDHFFYICKATRNLEHKDHFFYICKATRDLELNKATKEKNFTYKTEAKSLQRMTKEISNFSSPCFPKKITSGHGHPKYSLQLTIYLLRTNKTRLPLQ